MNTGLKNICIKKNFENVHYSIDLYNRKYINNTCCSKLNSQTNAN